jgi:uncharacterized membrane protein YbaN (DUF454 family)
MTVRSPLLRYLWMGAGFLSLGAGIAGIALPLVPTTPFLLLAAFCFARGSDRLHGWLLDHPAFGPPIRNWRDHRAISRRAKILSMAAIVAVFAVSIAVGVRGWIIAVQFVVLAAVSVFILSRPSAPEE